MLLLCCHRAAKDSHGLIPNAHFFYPSDFVCFLDCVGSSMYLWGFKDGFCNHSLQPVSPIDQLRMADQSLRMPWRKTAWASSPWSSLSPKVKALTMSLTPSTVEGLAAKEPSISSKINL